MTDMLSIADAFAAAAARFSDAPLIITTDNTRSFADVDRQSNGVARALIAAGVRKGERIGLYCPNVPEFVSAYLGIIKAGATVVPVNLLIQPAEIAFILNDAGVRGMIYHAALAEKVVAVRPQLDGVTFWACIGDAAVDPGDAAFADMLADSAPVETPALDPAQDLAAILYTSGTTGHPKGAMLTHANLVSNTHSVVVALQLRPEEDRVLVVLPMFHSFAATVGMLTPALHGVAMVPVARFDPGLVSDTIAAAGATVFLGVPSMYNVILRVDDEQAAKWAGIRYGVAGGAAMPVELLTRFEQRFGFPIVEGDGPTECSPVTCVNPLDGVRKPGSVGLPVPDVEIAILDDGGKPLPANDIGEISVRGPNVMKGYWNLPEATAETFSGDWLRTGDLGYLDDDGYIFMVDRKKDMVIVNGMNVYPRMVEEVLYAHPSIVEAAVVGEPHGTHGEIVVAYVVGGGGAELDDRELRVFCRERLGPHQMPRRFEIRAALPKNATGKILKRELRKAGEIERGVDPDSA